MKIEILLNNEKGVFDLTSFITDKITLQTVRKNTPSTLTFKIARNLLTQNNISINIDEGNAVLLSVNGNKLFKGFIFTKSRNKDQIITITCYDQIRYLRNKQSYTFVNKKASDIVKSIVNDFNLQGGSIIDTGYTLPPYNADNQTLLDIIMKALDYTSYNNKKLYILYDDIGKITLKELAQMKTEFVLTDDTNITAFNYSSSIDKNTFNTIKLYKDNKTTGQREFFVSKDAKTIGKWGVLQHFEKLDDNFNVAQAQKLANDILAQKNKITETLNVTVQNIYDTNKLETLRAGNFVYVVLKALSSGDFSKYCLIEKCTHNFSDNNHTISLELNGGE